MLIEKLAHAAVGGFGASFGRDLYRSAKKNPIVFVVIGALLLAFGWRNLFLGQGRSAAYFLFVTLIGSMVMILLGAVMTGLGGFYLSSIFSNPGDPSPWLAIALVSLISLIGIMWGRRDRRARRRRAEIEAKNILFLEEIGLEDSGFESDTLRDADGNILKVREQTEDRIVFSVSGRRGLRSAISLQDGEMIAYTGVVRA
jgi:hypothetical protein